MSGITTKTTKHHGRDVVWNESGMRFGSILDEQVISIQKMHPSTYQVSRGGNLADPTRPRYRVLVNHVFVQPHWGFRRTLKEAKDDGVAMALAAADHMKKARAVTKARRESKTT